MKNAKLISLAAILFVTSVLAPIVFIYIERPANAQTGTNPPPQPDRISFGIMGITAGQTARINIFNANPLDYEPHPCLVNIHFVDTSGRVLRGFDGQPIRRIATLQNGQSIALDLNSDEVPRDVRARLQVRAVVTVASASDSSYAPPCFPSVEVFNNASGRTQFMVPARTAANPEG